MRVHHTSIIESAILTVETELICIIKQMEKFSGNAKIACFDQIVR
jgi:hypothetical protein